MPENEILRLARRYIPDARAVTAVFESGWAHRAYEIDGWAIVKVPRFEAAREELAREAAVLLVLNDALDLPVPRLLGFCDVEAGRPAYSCMTRLPGAPLQRFDGDHDWLKVGLKPPIVEAIAALVARLHALPIEPFETSRAVPLLDVDGYWERGIAWLDAHGLLAAAEIARLNELFQARSTRFPAARPVLLHGDLWPTNSIVDASGRFTGLIDFGDACLGPAAWEFSGCDDDPDHRWPRALLDTYARIVPVAAWFREEAEFYRLVNAVRYPAVLEPWAPGERFPQIVRTCLYEIRQALKRT